MGVWKFIFILNALLCMAARSDEKSPASPSSINDTLTIAFFNPSSPSNTFWPQVFFAIQEAADDLGFQFLHYDMGVHDRTATEHEIKRVLESKVRIDAIMASTTVNAAKRILYSGNAENQIIVFEGPLYPFETRTLIENAKKNPNWLGFFQQNEEEKGYRLAKLLIERARGKKSFAKDGKIHLVGIGGTKSWYGSTLRELGLRRAVLESSDVVLAQVVSGNWTTDRAKFLSQRLLNRHPDTSVIWVASDQMALGAVAAFKQRGKVLGKTAFTGGIDLSDSGLEQVSLGNFEATVGSSTTFYANIAVFLFDFLRNAKGQPRTVTDLKADVYTATLDNWSDHALERDLISEVDFRRFSMTYNPTLKGYDFSWTQLLKEACRKKELKSDEIKQLCRKKN